MKKGQIRIANTNIKFKILNPGKKIKEAYSKRKRDGFTFALLAGKLFGNFWFTKMKRLLSVRETKAFYYKILNKIGFDILDSIITDNIHKTELLGRIKSYRDLIKVCKDFDGLDEMMISFQTEFIFLLIGYDPNKIWIGKTIRNLPKKGNAGYRQINYNQTYQQKRMLLFNVIENCYSNKLKEYKKIYYTELRRNDEQFIEWIRKNQSEIYANTF